MQWPDSRTPTSPQASDGTVAVVVHHPDGSVAAAGEAFRSVTWALGSARDSAPHWFAAVVERLDAGEEVVCREDPTCDGRGIVASEHRLLVAAAGERLIASRYHMAAQAPAPEVGATAAQRLADVLRLSSEWLYETDAALNLAFISDRVFDDLGALPAELIGTPLPEIGVFDAGPGCFAEQQDAGRRRPFADRMADVRHADGSVHRVRFSGVPVFGDSGFAGYRGIARDETRQQSAADAAARAEARLTMGLAASRDGFAVFDADGLLVCANPQIAFDLGRTEALPPGMELNKLLNHALKSGWFIDTDAPSLSSTRPSLSNPDGQAMIEITLADGRRLLFCACRTDCDDILLVSTDITGLKGRQVAPRHVAAGRVAIRQTA